MPAPDVQKKERGFEESLAQLDVVVQSLEAGQIGLAESLNQYEQGVKLLRSCYDMLDKAERRIELLSGVDSQGNPIVVPLDDQSSLAADQQQHDARKTGDATTEKPRVRRPKRPENPPARDVDDSLGLF